MTRLLMRAGLVAVLLAGGAGCGRSPAPPADRTDALETKAARLEDDFRSAAAARDAFRQKLTAAEQSAADLRRQHADLTHQLDAARQSAARDRDTLTAQLAARAAERDAAAAQATARTTERDAATAQVETIRKGLRELIGQADAPGGSPAGGTE